MSRPNDPRTQSLKRQGDFRLPRNAVDDGLLLTIVGHQRHRRHEIQREMPGGSFPSERSGPLQMSTFNRQNLAEISSPASLPRPQQLAEGLRAHEAPPTGAGD